MWAGWDTQTNKLVLFGLVGLVWVSLILSSQDVRRLVRFGSVWFGLVEIQSVLYGYI